MRATSAAIFLLYRTLGDGIRLHAAALVLSLAAGVPEWWCIACSAIAMILYTEEGGVTATIWTDTIQMFVYLAGAVVCLVAVLHALPQSFGTAMEAAVDAGKLRVFDFSFDLRRPYTFWAGLLGGLFLTLATHGTDHYLVQRLLVARTKRDASFGLVISGFLVFAQFALFLVLGTLFWVYYGGRPFARGDEVLPTFVTDKLPGAWVGFILAAIVAAALSPSLNSMASATVRDFYLPYFRPHADEQSQMRMARFFTVVWGLAQIAVALVAQQIPSALEAGLAALGYASGPTVGAFLLGVLTRRATTGRHHDRDAVRTPRQPLGRPPRPVGPGSRRDRLDVERPGWRRRDVPRRRCRLVEVLNHGRQRSRDEGPTDPSTVDASAAQQRHPQPLASSSRYEYNRKARRDWANRAMSSTSAATIASGSRPASSRLRRTGVPTSRSRARPPSRHSRSFAWRRRNQSRSSTPSRYGDAPGPSATLTRTPRHSTS